MLPGLFLLNKKSNFNAMSLLYLEVTFKSPDFVLTTILSSSIVSAFITFLLNKKQKQDDFKTEYKKFIVEKRKAAYSKLEEIISVYSKSSIVETLHGRYYGPVIFHNRVHRLYL